MLDCYYMNVSCDCSKEQSLALYEGLTHDRKKRVDKLRNKTMADKQILISAFLQRCLSGYVDEAPSQIVFEYNEQGKPYIESGVQFNMSHSGDYVVLAISDRAVGIDIERIRHNKLSVAKRFFCEEEYEDILNAGDEHDRELRFLEYWTMKEAYVKYLGKGLSVPLNSFVIKKVPEEDKSVCILSTHFKEDYNISLCYRRESNSDNLLDEDLIKEVRLDELL